MAAACWTPPRSVENGRSFQASGYGEMLEELLGREVVSDAVKQREGNDMDSVD
jgi:hypothetical protein